MRRKNTYHPVKEYEMLPECLTEVEKMHGGKSAFTVFENNGIKKTVSYKTFVSEVRALAYALCERKLGKKHIAIAGDSSYEWVLGFCAVAMTGGVAIAIDVEQPEKEMQQMAAFADAAAVIADAFFEPVFREQKLPVIVNGVSEAGLSMELLLEEGKEKIAKQQITDFSFCPEITRDSPMAIVYTSGTTSTSKPVVLTHYNMMFNACHTQSLVTVGKKLFNPLPLYHTYSLVCGVLDSISQGLDICISGNLKTFQRDLLLYQPDTLISVPLILDNLLKEVHRLQQREGVREKAVSAIEHFQKRKQWKIGTRPWKDSCVEAVLGKSIRYITCGGAHLNEKTAEEFEAYGIGVFQGYGITECSPLISSNQNDDNVFASVGRVIPETEIGFEDGEILVKGPSVFREYYKNHLLTEESFTGEWFHTGDIGYLDRRGHLYICGRKKNLIVFNNGKKVVPEELEGYLLGIPMVKEVMVYGASAGETRDDVRLSAMICIDKNRTDVRDNYEILEQIQEEINVLNKSLPDYKRIQNVKLSEAEFKKTAMQKMKRREAL